VVCFQGRRDVFAGGTGKSGSRLRDWLKQPSRTGRWVLGSGFNEAGERGKKGGSFSTRRRFSGSSVKGFVKLRAGRSGKVVRCRDSLKTMWAGKSGHVNELVKNGAGGRGKSSSYLLKTRRAKGKGLRVVMSD